MIRNSSQPGLLLVATTLAAALMLSLMPFASAPFVPDLMALFIAFWAMHDPRRIGIAAAFSLGLLVDACTSPVFGTHALSYTVLAYLVLLLRSRILWVPIGIQGIYMLPVFALAKLALLAVSLWFWGTLPDLAWYSSILSEAILWPFVGALHEFFGKGRNRASQL